MSERFQDDLPDVPAPEVIGIFQPLPGWLADRLLKADEKVTWVRGPWLNPSWERYITHPVLFLLALAIGAASTVLGGVISGGSPEILAPLAVGAGFLVIASILVLGIANGYFTRLVVTNFRLVILQGYETVRSWSIDDLPYSMLHYGRRDGDNQKPWIDVDAVKTLFGASSDQFTDAKTILSFGKELDRIRKRDRDRG
ncbi:MAG: hypothetical protein ACRELF_02110 [Gemmataceae bacterium]